jgi:hypothetical protein
MPRLLAILVLITVVLAPAAAGEDEPAVRIKRLNEILGQARPYLERATGLPWPKGLTIERTDPAGMYTMLLAEYRRDVAILHPARSESSRELLAQMLARSMTKVVRAKYGLITKKIHVASTALDRLPEGLEPDRVLVLIVVHEAVHAMDDRAFDLSKAIAGTPDAEALRALRMVIEGRAEWHGGRVAALLGASAEVEKKLAARRDVGERVVRDAGRAFVEAIGKRDPKLAATLLTRPPRTTSEVFHPDRYGRDDPAPDAAAPLLATKLAPQAEILSELRLRKRIATRLEPAAVEKMFAGYLSGAAVVARDRTRFTLTEHGSEAGAKAFLKGLMAFEGQGAGDEASFATGAIPSPDGRRIKWWAWRRGARVIHVVGDAAQDPGKRLGTALAPLPPKKGEPPKKDEK